MADAVVPGPGDIGLVRIPGAGGFLIRLGQWLNGDGFADLEHAFVVVDAPDRITAGLMEGGQLVEAEPGGARSRPLSQYGGAAITWLRCPDEYRADVAAAARSMVGVGYSAADYFALAAHRLHIPVPGIRRYIASTRREICSQLADEAARRGGWHLLSGVWPGYVTPGALRKLAEKQGGASA